MIIDLTKYLKFEVLVSKTSLRSKLSESSLLKNESGSCFERNAFCQKETASHTRKSYSRSEGFSEIHIELSLTFSWLSFVAPFSTFSTSTIASFISAFIRKAGGWGGGGAAGSMRVLQQRLPSPPLLPKPPV